MFWIVVPANSIGSVDSLAVPAVIAEGGPVTS